MTPSILFGLFLWIFTGIMTSLGCFFVAKKDNHKVQLKAYLFVTLFGFLSFIFYSTIFFIDLFIGRNKKVTNEKNRI